MADPVPHRLDWDAAILRACKAPSPDQRHYLYVDADVLAGASGLPPREAVEAFTRYFRNTRGARPFDNALSRARRWRQRGYPGTPPLVSALAMTVLAVTEDPVAAGAGVYRTQNALLGLDPVAAAPPGYGEDVRALWLLWNEWLAGPGAENGLPSARTHAHWTLQGWARSQAVVRYRDRLTMEDFFAQQALHLRGPQPATALLSELTQWLRYRGQVGESLLERLDDEPSREIICDVLAEEAARWTGVPRARRSQGEIRGLLAYDELTESFAGAVTVDDSLHGVPLDTGGGNYTPSNFDQLVLLQLATPPQQLLGTGAVHELAPGRRVRVGGEPVYVLRDDPGLGVLLQARTATLHDRGLRLLGSTAHLKAVARELALPEARTCLAAPGWSWMTGLPASADPATLHKLRLGFLVRQRPAGVVLTGGLPVRSGIYLSGHEPDVSLPDGAGLVLDGAPADVEHPVPWAGGLLGAPGTVRLADLALDPGTHSVGSEGEQHKLTVVTHVREAAADGNVAWRLPLGPGAEPVRGAEEPRLAGALLSGSPPAYRLVVQLRPGQELLALCEDGALLQVFPSLPAWLSRAGLTSCSVDVLAALRTLDSPAAFVLVRSPHSKRIFGVEIPAQYTPLPGRARTAPRPELVGQVFGVDWSGLPASAMRRRSDLVSRLVGWGAPALLKASAKEPAKAALALRSDIVQGAVPANPYDDVLMWLSERESARCSAAQFRDAWAWACLRHGMSDLAEQWRFALNDLAGLGHVERDYGRRQVSVAPAALLDLSNAAGLGLLTGARPVRLLERLADDEDLDEGVAAAAAGLDLHLRTPLKHGLPAGPTAVYVDWDRRNASQMTAALAALGVTHVGAVSDALLAAMPTKGSVLRASPVLETSPSRVSKLRERTGHLTYRYVERANDTARGLYRYQLAHGDVFGWRAADQGPLVRVDRHLGVWLDTAARETTPVVAHHEVRQALLVPAHLPLPALAHRALILRTGLPPWTSHGLRLDGHGPGHDYRVYDNVNGPTAEAIFAVLGLASHSSNDQL
ncbi:hypothetical protein [Motilibacter peucedani]|uniref:hypothetical protein n=1 Tax=Motilibacter peucedani TaxID=598650 RepID=UPI000EB076FC|nr:hypothetical protein [Motilibacter peucedani]